MRAAQLGSRSLYLVPAQGAVCLALVEEHLGAAVGCEAADAVERGAAGPAYVLTDCGGPAPEQGGPMCAGIVLYGVVPDGVSGVSVERREAQSAGIAVRDNAFIYAGSAKGISAVRYVLPTGREVWLDVPL